MKIKLLILISFLLSAFCILSCSNNGDRDFLSTDTGLSSSLMMNKEKGMARFSEILSKAVYEKKEVREFLKAEALKRFDNDYNVFYPIVKDLAVDGKKSFREVLMEYAASRDELESIEKSVPLLNIHLPEILNLKVKDLNAADKELPVLYSSNLYLNGTIVERLNADEIPAFALFVVSESGSVKRKQGFLKCSNSELSINGDYEYVDATFVGNKDSRKFLKEAGYEVLSEKYMRDGIVPRNDIDPELLEAYKNSVSNRRATRCLMYYGMTNLNQTPGNVRSDVKDCIFRFKIAPDAFQRLESIATNGGKDPFFNGSTSNKKSALSREEVLRRLLTGKAFCFMFRIEGVNNGQVVTTEGMKVYVTPEKLFNLYINESYRHSTSFRHSKYTYSINTSNIQEKWFYPMDHGHDTRLNEWDITSQPITKRVVVYLIDPNDGITENVTEHYSVTYVTSNEVGANISGKIMEIITIGINGKLNSTTTTTKEVTTTYAVTHSNEKLDEFEFNFFNDYPIETTVNDDKYIVPVRKGRGIIETSILPISTNFFTYKRFNKQ